MASTSGSCSHELKGLRLSDPSYAIMGDSSEDLYMAVPTRGSEVDHATTSMTYFSTVLEQIEQSKAHWSTLVDHSSDEDEEKVDFEISNERVFKALQRHPRWGAFFANFSGDGISTGSNYEDSGELVLGEKFAEGGQAELYQAQIKWNDPRNVEMDQRLRCEWVVKVFKEGILVKHLKSQLPEGVLGYRVELQENLISPTRQKIPRYVTHVDRGVLLKGGRFAFLMKKERYDLRTLIDHNMKLRRGEHYRPFSNEEAEAAMFHIALGVEWLHNREIVHRDLKASNVFTHAFESGWPKWQFFVGDYECSIGVVGTTFFRAPEILHACKERKVNERPEVFSRAADVYSYGMTCYEILTGKLPFQDHPLDDSPGSLLIDLVINQQLRPEVPLYVENWMCTLLSACWQFDPTTRPSIGEILNVLLDNSVEVRRLDVWLKEYFGENYRI